MLWLYGAQNFALEFSGGGKCVDLQLVARCAQGECWLKSGNFRNAHELGGNFNDDY